MQALPVTADKRRTPAGVSAQAMLGRTDSPYDTCLAIFNQGWIHPIDFIERMSALLDELIGARAIGFQTQWMCDPNDPAAVLEYVVTNRLVMPDPQQRVSAALTKVLSGYTVADNASRLRRHVFDPVVTDRLRVVFEATNGADCVEVYEARIYGPNGPIDRPR